MVTTVKGNPYNHSEETRTSIPGREVCGGCNWCGNEGRRTLYIYGRDFRNRDRYCFCNKECYRAFMGS